MCLFVCLFVCSYFRLSRIERKGNFQSYTDGGLPYASDAVDYEYDTSTSSVAAGSTLNKFTRVPFRTVPYGKCAVRC